MSKVDLNPISIPDPFGSTITVYPTLDDVENEVNAQLLKNDLEDY